MKTKNLSLAVIAFTFAIGSAFASMFAASDIIVKGRAVNDPIHRLFATTRISNAKPLAMLLVK